MKHYGAEPPWEGEGELGRWVRVQPDPRLWIREEPYWEWRPRRTALEAVNDVLRQVYLPAWKATLEQELFFLRGEGVIDF